MTGSDLWVRLCDQIVRGAHHELNNRVASLSAVEQVLSAGGSRTPGLHEALISELVRMRWAVDLLGRIPPAAERAPTALRPQDTVATAIELVALHHDARDTRVEVGEDEDVPPVRADQAALERSLLLILACAARAAEGGVAVTFSSGASRVRITVGTADASATAAAYATEAERLAIAAWLRPSDGILEDPGEDGSLTISLPALTPPPTNEGS